MDVRAECFVGKLLEFRRRSFGIFLGGLAEDIGTGKILRRSAQEQNLIAQRAGGCPEHDLNAGIMGWLEDGFRSYGRWEKNRPKVLVDALDREVGAGFLPFDDLGMDGLEAVILQTLGGCAGGGDGNNEEEQYRSHDSILEELRCREAFRRPPGGLHR